MGRGGPTYQLRIDIYDIRSRDRPFDGRGGFDEDASAGSSGASPVVRLASAVLWLRHAEATADLMLEVVFERETCE